MNTPERIVIVGASLAGVHAAKALRREGFEHEVVVIGSETHSPYDRPPLSKQVFTESWGADRIGLAGVDDLDVTWELGCTARSLDTEQRVLHLDDDRELAFSGLVIATGARPRTLAGADSERVHTLRTLDDARAIAATVRAGARRVVVVGAGFIGAEVAASCRTLGVDVTLVEPLDQPLQRVLGPGVGAVVAEIHRSRGVDVRLGVGVDSIVDQTCEVVVNLGDGEQIRSDLVVVGIGVTPNTEWLQGSGLTLDNGVLCDETTLAAPGIVAAGDVARWPNPLFGEVMRVEHWENAIDMGGHAARRLLDRSNSPEAFAPVPWFWTDQYEHKLQVAGRVGPDDEQVVVAGSLDEKRFCVFYGRDGRLVGVVALNMPARVVRGRQAIADRQLWSDAIAH